MKKIYYGKTKFQKFMKSKGFYMVLAVCLVGAGIISFLGINSVMGSIDDNNSAIIENQKKNNDASKGAQQTEQGVSGVKKPSDSSQDSSKSSSSQGAQNEQSNTSKQQQTSQTLQNQLYILPTAGEVVASFSGDKLVKNETLNVWRTHNGIDVKAAKGTPVKAVNAGQVTKVFEDAVWGVAIEISHSDGMKSTYYGLDNAIKVKEKDNVKLGDIIGVIGTIPGEKDYEHIHFEMKKADNFIDPMSVIKTSKN